jgi:hypothetical protein
MALLPKSVPGLPFWVVLNSNLLQGWIVNPAPNPQLEGQVSVFMTPGDRVVQLYSQALGTHFSRLVRHAWVTVGLFFNPGHHTGSKIIWRQEIFQCALQKLLVVLKHFIPR